MSQYSDGGMAKAEDKNDASVKRALTPEAQRALAEAEERRLKTAADLAKAPEYNGRGGLEPVRFGDWEVKGIATDF